VDPLRLNHDLLLYPPLLSLLVNLQVKKVISLTISYTLLLKKVGLQI